MPELKPCPFCGSIAVIYEYDDVLGEHYIVECKSENGCFVKPKTEWFDTKGMAIGAWNRRVNDGKATD